MTNVTPTNHPHKPSEHLLYDPENALVAKIARIRHPQVSQSDVMDGRNHESYRCCQAHGGVWHSGWGNAGSALTAAVIHVRGRPQLGYVRVGPDPLTLRALGRWVTPSSVLGPPLILVVEGVQGTRRTTTEGQWCPGTATEDPSSRQQCRRNNVVVTAEWTCFNGHSRCGRSNNSPSGQQVP